jgi:hypothetical protein
VFSRWAISGEESTTIRNALFASLIAAAAGAAQARAPDAAGRVSRARNVVVGGAATIAGGADDTARP